MTSTIGMSQVAKRWGWILADGILGVIVGLIALVFPIATNLVDGVRIGEPDFTPSWEYAERHPSGWTEIVFVLTDDGFGHVILVPDSDEVDPALRRLCQLADKPAASAQQTKTH